MSRVQEDDDFVVEGSRTKSARSGSALSDEALASLSAHGSQAAGRMARNRESARRSRAGFAHRMALLETEADRISAKLEDVTAASEDALGMARTMAIAEAAKEAAARVFEDDVPPTRASGSRTSVTDEELQRRAMAGDVKAERMLNNRQSARLSRKRKWDAWNALRLRVETSKSILAALQDCLKSESLAPHERKSVISSSSSVAESEGRTESDAGSEDDDATSATSPAPSSPPTPVRPLSGSSSSTMGIPIDSAAVDGA